MIKHLQKLFALVLLCCAFLGSSGNAFGQVVLSSSPYQQDFNGIGQGLPEGWTVRTAATTSALGTTTAFTTALTAWSSTSGQFNNRASLDGLTATATATEQNASTDRALAIRQTATFGDPGAAFVFTLANTIGFRDFSIDFKAQELTNDGRTTVWTVDYGIGANPTTFTSTGVTITTSGIKSTDVTIPVSSLAALDNQNEPVHIRIVALSTATGSLSRDVFAIDDFKIVYQSVNSNVPSLIAPSALNLGDDVAGATLTKSYALSGRNLTNNITLTATGPFLISKSAANGFGSSLTFTGLEVENETVVYVQVTSSTAGAVLGTITHDSEEIDAVVLNVSANFGSPFTQDFSNCGTTLPGGWTAQNVIGAQVWECTTFGRTNNAVQINGFSSGAKNNEDWLISPAINLSNINIPLLSFWTRSAFVGPALRVMISTNYDGTSAPSTATWTRLDVVLPEVGTDVWTQSEVLLDLYKQSSVHVAFVYNSIEGTDGASRWSLDDFMITDEPRKLVAENATFDFGAVPAWSFTEARYVKFKALGFTENIVINSNHPDFEVSKNNVNFSQSVSYTPTEAATGELFIRFLPKSTFLGIKSVITATSSEGFSQALGTLTGSSIPKSTTLDVVTWNVEWFGADKDGDGKILGPSDDALQYQNVKKAMEILDADIYALQEIANDEKMAQLIDEMPGYNFVKSDVFSYSLRPSNFVSTPQKLYYVYKNSTVTLKNEKVLLKSLYTDLLANTTELAAYPGSGTAAANDDAFWASGRLPYMAEFEVNIAGVTQRLHLLNIHARANSGSNTTVVAQRRYDLKVLKDSLDAQYPNINLIMLGDYNDDVDMSVVGTNQPSTYDIFVNDADYKVLTYELSLSTTEGSFNRSSFLDHIAVSKRLTNSYINNSARIEEGLYTAISRYHTTTSDHGPVSARFYLSATPVVAFADAAVTKTEGEAAFNVNLTINAPQSTEQTVTISIADGATASANDYTLNGAQDGKLTVTIPANASTASFGVSVVDDNMVEASEEVTFVISNTSSLLGISDKRNFKLTIQDNDRSAISFAVSNQQVNENAGTVTVTLNLDQASLKEEQVVVNVTNGAGAVYGAQGDYTTTPAVVANAFTVVIPAGATSATFTVAVLNDTKIEEAETVTFALGTLSNGLITGEKAAYALTIQDDDKSVINFAIASLGVAEGSGELTVTLELDQPTTAEETIGVTVNSNAVTGVDYTTTPAVANNLINLTIPAGATRATFVVNVLNDDVVEANEIVNFVLSNPSAGLQIGTRAAFALTITDTDKSTISFAVTQQQVSEDIGTVTVTLNLSQATVKEEQVVINVANGAGVTYGAQGDYTTNPAVTNNTITAVVPAGALTATFTVIILRDTEAEMAETITFGLGTLSSRLAAGQNTTYALTIESNGPNGIADATKGQFNVYPNPAVGSINLLLPERVATQSKVNVTVYSLDGKKVLNAAGTLDQVQKQVNAQSANLQGGMYIVMVQAGKEYFQTKLIKQ